MSARLEMSKLPVSDAPFVEYLLPLSESYRRLPRRVGPWIDTDEFWAEDRPALRLNDPSEPALRKFHMLGWVQRLVAVLDERLSTALERPVVRHQRADGRGHAVVVLFSGVIEIEDERMRKASLVPLEAQSTPWRESTLPTFGDVLEEGQLSISPSPFEDRWLWRYIDAVFLAMKTCTGGLLDDLAWRYTTWLFVQMRRRHWGPAQRRRIRSAVAEGLGLNETALQLAHQVRPVFSERNYVVDTLYNFALRSLRAWSDVHRAAPKLLPLYALVSHDLEPGLEPLAALRCWVLNPNGVHGAIQPRFWRWMHRYGTRWLADLRTCLYDFTPHTVRGVLLFVSAFEFEGPASPALLRSVARLYGNPNGPGRTPADWYQSKVLKPLAVWWHRADAAERSELVAWAPALANWMVDRMSPEEASSMARRSWHKARLLMEVDAAAERADAERLDQEAPLPWTQGLPAEGLRDGLLTLKLLKRAVDVVEEGQRMHHCARQYLADCRAGAALMASVTEFRRCSIGAGTVRIATVLLRPGSRGWRVAQIAGPSNALAGPAVARLARKACEVLNQSSMR